MWMMGPEGGGSTSLVLAAAAAATAVDVGTHSGSRSRSRSRSGSNNSSSSSLSGQGTRTRPPSNASTRGLGGRPEKATARLRNGRRTLADTLVLGRSGGVSWSTRRQRDSRALLSRTRPIELMSTRKREEVKQPTAVICSSILTQHPLRLGALCVCYQCQANSLDDFIRQPGRAIGSCNTRNPLAADLRAPAAKPKEDTK
jgi:hypothetical protein